ncbi:hypothetical protein [Actinomadura rupiterrae]|uniref:hypothetical protein n=1 Tax=Actinomadura rupiterrae TaxID=559627 RepID=UPI0020A46DA6|nr:hypothetical protein [Actinomadura rupiterrae]MCP2343384.1 hypothetical protein [Actinomadura rupiterrae]
MRSLTVVAGALATKHAAGTTAARPTTNLHDPATTPTPVTARTTSGYRPAGTLCPTCRTPLDGGPVHFRCPYCCRAVMAAEIDHESHAPLTVPAWAMARAELGEAA